MIKKKQNTTVVKKWEEPDSVYISTPVVANGYKVVIKTEVTKC